MNKTLLVITFLLLSIASTAQKIHFTDTTNQWTYYLHNCSGETGITPTEYNDSYSGDTLIGGISYRRLLQSYLTGLLYVREDTIAQKVYVRGVGDTADDLLYDYTLNVGDSFYAYPGTPAHATFYVASEDSVQINTLWYKTWYLISAAGSTLPAGISYTIIEGIGCDQQPLFPVKDPPNPERCTTVTCFHNKGTQPLVSPEVDGYFDNASSCSLTFGLGVNRAC